MKPVHDKKGVTIYHGDCVEVMRGLPDNSVDSIVTDPPYGIRFMGKAWDGADIEKQTAKRRSYGTNAPGAGPQGGHNSAAANAGQYDLSLTANQAFAEWTRVWSVEAFRVLKPGGHMLVFCGPRTYHRMASGVEDAGFEIRDQIMWIYGSGFPKSLDISKAIDKAAGAEREVISEGSPVKRMIPGADQDKTGSWIKDNGRGFVPSETAPATPEAITWDGWGTALKPAHEPIVVARKPLIGKVIENVLEYGAGGINIDASRIQGPPWKWGKQTDIKGGGFGTKRPSEGDVLAEDVESDPKGRWPSNIILDPEAAKLLDRQSGESTSKQAEVSNKGSIWGSENDAIDIRGHDDSGGASRFFYIAKASASDRDEGLEGMPLKECGMMEDDNYPIETGSGNVRDTKRRNFHPTVKPTVLMQYLVRLVTPPGGTTFDMFMGSGSTGKAAVREGFKFIGVEREAEYIPMAIARINAPAQVELF